ncbi:endonuclease/Exonuclease/phosphatase family domain-containing protein [Ditylenchus destructor]|uniref:Endonuclease/Exonuclease/phosphatase family domain-containing protein n=1 Tax=Ditylenchus destructor TaxID=166010 RepID=A0AAD4R982_9BILA|nr:endonuclease/Exonuclease/phosphatase family domain-containing protein [Ditylenchus destructor]
MTFYTPQPAPSYNGIVANRAIANDQNLLRHNSSSFSLNGFLERDPFENLLHQHEKKFCTYSHVNIFATTFNVNGKPPPQSLCDWLHFDTTCLPDIIAIGLQEMDLAMGSYVGGYVGLDNSLRQDEWLFTLSRNLPNIYKPIANVRLVGIFLVLYHREDSKVNINEVYLSTVATGFGLLSTRLGNKGGVGVSLKINDTSVCFINSHLAAGSNELPKRNQDFREISQMRFANGLGIYDHEAAIWIGDLNYRLNLFNYDEVVRDCTLGRYEHLFLCDQLKEQQFKKTAFINFHENMPTFRPTYKFDVGTSNWDTSEKRRIPAWCDRILYWTRDKCIKVQQSNYTSIEKVIFSDHKPVCCTFRMEVKRIDHQKRNAIYEELLRDADRRSNDMLPMISLSQTEFKFGEVYFDQPAIAILGIKNTGQTPTRFFFAKQHQDNNTPKNWLTGIVPPIPDLSCILVLRLDQGRDYFVVINAKYAGTKKDTESEKIVNDNAARDDWLIDLGE